MFRGSARIFFLAFAICGLAASFDVRAQEEDIAAERAKKLEKIGTTKLTQPNQVDQEAKQVLTKPLESQLIADLEKLAANANMAANLVDLITKEYKDYYEANYRYEFVQKKLAPAHDGYIKTSNRMKDIRNQCYFNIGAKYRLQGDDIRALFYFADAFRLSTFEDGEGDHKRMRYKAEIEMKKILGIENLETYTSWQ